ncbi:MAG: hypothetical protein BWY89_01945 [Bacteroidetes bacterium ADurb.BinA012]|nr:MAG: hypothetical protein BWY89_01945 [Bacteroidetes bacterium ADurb.BinA012]
MKLNKGAVRITKENPLLVGILAVSQGMRLRYAFAEHLDIAVPVEPVEYCRVIM